MPLVRLADYRPAPFLLDRTDLVVQLHADHSEVAAQLAFRPNPAAEPGPLLLQGVDLELLELAIDGRKLEPGAYQLGAGELLIAEPPTGAFLLESRVRLHPHSNTTLEGLYVSGGLFTTQCEAEGFRRITFHPDRPDLLSRFRVRIEADRASCPVLLSNGNCIETGDLDERAPLRCLGRPLPQALLPVCPGGRPAGGGDRQLHHRQRPPGGPAHPRGARRWALHRPRHGFPEARHGLGWAALWPRIRPR